MRATAEVHLSARPRRGHSGDIKKETKGKGGNRDRIRVQNYKTSTLRFAEEEVC